MNNVSIYYLFTNSNCAKASGIGLALTKELVTKGWNVSMVDISTNGPEISKGFGDSVDYYHVDVSDYDQQAKMFQSVWDKHGRLDFGMWGKKRYIISLYIYIFFSNNI